MLKKIVVMLFLIFLVVGIVSAADNNSTDDTLKTNEKNSDEIVKTENMEILNEQQQSTVTVRFVNAITDEEYGSQTNTISEGGSWGFTMVKFNNMIANHKTFKLDGYKYTFTHWSGEDGIVDGTQRFYCTGNDYTVTYYANYDRELLGRLIFILNDEHGHNDHYMTYNDEADYRFTFKEPVDVEEGYRFLYYEHAKTGETYNPGDAFSILYSEFQGQEVTVEINAIYEKIVENNTENETIDNNASENQTIENETVIDNNTSDTDKIDDIDNNTENKTMNDRDADNSTSDNHTSVLTKHKTGIVFIGLVVFAILIGSLIYIKRDER